MSPLNRVESERRFHDNQAQQRATWFARHPDQLHFSDATYLDHETWIRPALEKLGDIHGLRVLDYGCGHGMAAVVLARHGGRVTAFDLSGGYIAEARRRAGANNVAINFIQADGERLPFAANSFDRIWGNAVLHHLDIPTAAAELYRVLRPGGWAVFCEPWGENPLLRWARRRLPYSAKHRTANEEPLRQSHIRQLAAVFPQVALQGFQLLSMARRVLPGRLSAGLDRCDRRLLDWMPALQRFCRYMVLTLHR